jgi:hypothetical protein
MTQKSKTCLSYAEGSKPVLSHVDVSKIQNRWAISPNVLALADKVIK